MIKLTPSKPPMARLGIVPVLALALALMACEVSPIGGEFLSTPSPTLARTATGDSAGRATVEQVSGSPSRTPTAISAVPATPELISTPYRVVWEVSTSTPTPSSTPTVSPAPPTRTSTRTPTRTAIPYPGKLATVISRGTSRSVVALTFDAGGTEGGATGKVLDTLKAFGYRATFFLTGEWSAANPELVRRMVAEGHELGNHTYDHPDLRETLPSEIASQLVRTEVEIRQAGGVQPRKILRPPFGSYDDTVRVVLSQHDHELVFWSLDSGDWQELTPAKMIERFNSRVTAGDVAVFHSYATNTGQAIRGICECLRAKGLKGGTLSQALGR